MGSNKPKIKTVTTRFHEEEEREDPRQQAELPSEAEATWDSFKGKFSINQGAKVKVYRQTPRGRQYCFFGTPSEIDEESIRVFHCKQPNAHEPTDYYLALEIDGVLQEPFCVPIAPQVATPGADVQASGGHGGMADVIRLLQQQNERLEQRLMQQERTPMNEMVDALYKLDQLRGGPQQGGANNLDNVLKCIEIGQKMGPNAGNTEWWQVLLEAVKENGPLLQGILMRMMPRSGDPAPPQQHEPIPPQAIPGGTTEEQFKMNDQQEKAMLVQAVAYLKKKALAGSDPGLYVDIVLDNQEDPIYARLLSEIADKDFPSFVQAIDPELEKPQYRGFFTFIYDGLRSYLDKTNQVATAGHGKDGNKADHPVNGGTGKAGRK